MYLDQSDTRFRHAQRLAQAAFAGLHHPPSSKKQVDDSEESEEGLDIRGRPQRSAQLVAQETAIYGMRKEQARSLAVALERGAPRLRRACELWCDERRANDAAMCRAAMLEVEMCLGPHFGGGDCRVKCALIEPGKDDLTIVTTSEKQDDGMVSMRRCIALNDVVVDGDDLAAPFVVVPLRQKGGLPIGCLCVSGLNRAATKLAAGNDVDPRVIDEEEHDDSEVDEVFLALRLALLRLVAKKSDPAAARSLKLWRLPPTRNGLFEREVESVAARVVCGTISEVRRVPRKLVGGHEFVFQVHWEDGLHETEISLRGMKELLRVTPWTFGVGSPLDDAVLEFVQFASLTVGSSLIELRRKVAVDRVSKAAALQTKKHGMEELFEAGLRESLACVLSSKTAEIWSYEGGTTGDSVTVRGRMSQNGGQMRLVDMKRRLLEMPAEEHAKCFWKPLILKGGPMKMWRAEEVLLVPFEQHDNRGLVLAVTRKAGHLDDNDLNYVAAVATAMAAVLERIRAREARSLRRQAALDRFRSGNSDCLAECALGVEGSVPRLASIRKGAEALEYEHLVLSRSCCFFDVLPPLLPTSMVVDDPETPPPPLVLAEDVRVEIKYGGSYYPGIIIANRGHECFDVVYDAPDHLGRPQREAGVHARRIRAPSTVVVERRSKTDDVSYPFIMARLGLSRGVLVLDEWASQTPEPLYDRPHVEAFLGSMAETLGATLDRRLKSEALIKLGLVATTGEPSRGDVARIALSTVRDCCPWLGTVKLLKSEHYDDDRVRELGFLTPEELLKEEATFALSSSFCSVLHDCVVVDEAGDVVISRPGLVFVAEVKHSSDTFAADMAFSAAVAKVASHAFYCVTLRDFNDIIRAESLRRTIKKAKAFAFGEDDADALCSFVAREIERVVLPGTNAGFLMLDPGCSTMSSTTTKRLRRTQALASFQCVDRQRSAVVQEMARTSLTEEEMLNKWPVVMLPLARCHGTCVGLLTVQGFQDMPFLDPREPTHPQQGALAYLEDLAVAVGTALDQRSKKDEMSRLHFNRHNNNDDDHLKDIYAMGLVALRSQIRRASRLEIVAIRRKQHDMANLEHHNLALVLDLVAVEGTRKQICAVVEQDGVGHGRASTDENFEFSSQFTLRLGPGWLQSSLLITLYYVDDEEVGEVMGRLELRGSYYLHLDAQQRSYACGDARLSLKLRLESEPTQEEEDEEEDILEEQIEVCRVSGLNLEAAEYSAKIGTGDESVDFGIPLEKSRSPVFEGCQKLGEMQSNWDAALKFTVWGRLRHVELRYTAILTSAENAALMHCTERIVTLKLEPSGPFFERQAAKELDLKRQQATEEPADDASYNSLTSMFGEAKKEGPQPRLRVTLREPTPRQLTSAVLSDDESFEAVTLCQVEAEMPRVSYEPRRHSLSSWALRQALTARGNKRPVACRARQDGGDSLLIAPFEDLGLRIGEKLVGPTGGTRFAIVLRTSADFSEAPLDLRFAADVAAKMESAVRYLRAGQLRKELRREALIRLNLLLEGSSVLNEALPILDDCLPGCCTSISLLQPGGNALLRVACNNQMLPDRLVRGDAESRDAFTCVDKDELMVLDDTDTILAPLSYEGHCIGLLRASSFENVAKSAGGPEAGVIDFIAAAARAIAAHVDLTAKAGANVADKTHSESTRAALRHLCDHVHYATGVEIWELSPEEDYPKKRRHFNVVARLTPGNEEFLISDEILFEVVVAPSPEAVEKRATDEGIVMPLRIAKAREDHERATRNSHSLLPEQKALVTELAFGQLARTALHARWDIDPRPTLVKQQDSPFVRIAVPLIDLNRRKKPRILVITASRVDAHDQQFAAQITLKLREALMIPEEHPYDHWDAQAPAPAPATAIGVEEEKPC